MTFTEAAAQVLRLVGKPLHYKEITDVAIEKDLLSHVGKSPEVTMGARLAALVKKGDKENPLVRVKPGVFALREWDDATIEAGLADRTPALKKIEQLEAKGDGTSEKSNGQAKPPKDAEKAAGAEAPEPSQPSTPALDEEDLAELDDEERSRIELAQTASDLFEPEEDDDEPILGGSDDDEDREEGRAGRSKRRRRRRRRSGNGAGDDLPGYTVSDAPAEASQAEAQQRPERAERAERSERSERAERSRAGEGPEAAGASLADYIASQLGRFERQGGIPLKQLADTVKRRVSADGSSAQALALAAMHGDNLRRRATQRRPRFSIGKKVGLTDWLLDGEQRRLEREIQALVDRYREAALRSLSRRVKDLPPRAVGELAMVLLERLGVTDLQVVKRPGSPGNELLLSGRTTDPVDVPTAIVVRTDGRDVGRERVTELRGTMHHFNSASACWIMTTGQVLSGAREEAAAGGASPVRLMDGQAFARALEEHGIGVVPTSVTLPLPDVDLFDSFRNP